MNTTQIFCALGLTDKVALTWAGSYEDPFDFWRALQSERVSLLLEVIGRLTQDPQARIEIVRSACFFASAALGFVPEGEERPKRGLFLATQWCDAPADESLQAAVFAAADEVYTASMEITQAHSDADDRPARAAVMAAWYALRAASYAVRGRRKWCLVPSPNPHLRRGRHPTQERP